MDYFLLFKYSDGLVQVLNGVLNKLLAGIGINGVPFPVHPHLLVLDPVVGGQPKMRVGLEILDQVLDFGVVSDFPLEEMLPGVEFPGFGLGIGQGLIDGLNLLGNFGMVFLLVIGMELRDGAAETFNSVLELFLVDHNLLLQVLLLQQDLILLLLDLVQNCMRGDHDQVAFLQIISWQVVPELFQDVVDLVRLHYLLVYFL